MTNSDPRFSAGSARVKKFRITKSGTNCKDYPAGTICYDLMMHDYGLASDDTRITGIPHVSVTLDPAGDYPSFTVVAADLEEVHD